MPSEIPPPFGALPAKQKPPTILNRRILRIFWILMPIQIVFFLVGALFVTMQICVWRGIGTNINSGAYSLQQTLSKPLGLQWVGQHNAGAKLAEESRWHESIGLLDEAYVSVPKADRDPAGNIQAYTYECSVRFTSSYAWEGLGDSRRDTGDTEGADQAYANALDLVSPCEMRGGDGDSDSADESENKPDSPGENSQAGDNQSNSDRIQEKRDELDPDRDQSDKPGETPDSSDGKPDDEDDQFSNETPDEQRRREELEQRKNEQRENEREREESYNRGSSGGGW